MIYAVLVMIRETLSTALKSSVWLVITENPLRFLRAVDYRFKSNMIVSYKETLFSLGSTNPN